LLPLALGIGAAASCQRRSRSPVIGGLTLSTPITLFAVPILLVAIRGGSTCSSCVNSHAAAWERESPTPPAGKRSHRVPVPAADAMSIRAPCASTIQRADREAEAGSVRTRAAPAHPDRSARHMREVFRRDADPLVRDDHRGPTIVADTSRRTFRPSR